MEDYRIEKYLNGKRLRLRDFDEYGILLNGTVDSFVYDVDGHTIIVSVSSIIRGKARFSDLNDHELGQLVGYADRGVMVTHTNLQRAIQLRELEKKLLEEGRISRGVA